MTAASDMLQRLLDEVSSVDYAESALSDTQRGWIDEIVNHAEQQKAVLAALFTSLTKKIEQPEQDIRLPKIEFAGGYSGRGYDTQFITPFIARAFPRLAMRSGSGWLTRSIEQAAPFDLDFPGRIQNQQVKTAFLSILHDVQEQGGAPAVYLRALMHRLVVTYHRVSVDELSSLAPEVTVQEAVDALKAHFFARYSGSGAARLPVIAIYSVYQLLMDTPRYDGKRLLPLKSHTTSDAKSGSLGDIEIVDRDDAFFEVIEIKHNISITPSMVENAIEKFRAVPLARYYLLTTAEPNTRHAEEIGAMAGEVLKKWGCEIIVNGIIPSLKYYLRLIPRPVELLERYSENLLVEYRASSDVKQTHIEQWERLRRPYLRGKLP